jgi:hypothetical protein
MSSNIDYTSFARGIKRMPKSLIKSVTYKNGHVGYNIPTIGFASLDDIASECTLAKEILERQAKCLPKDFENLDAALQELNRLAEANHALKKLLVDGSARS